MNSRCSGAAITRSATSSRNCRKSSTAKHAISCGRPWKVKTAEEGEKRLEQLARFLEREHESAARSLREGMQEMFTLQRLQIPESLHKCLATTNVIESLQSGVERRTHNVTRWRNAEMVQRWVASAWLLTEKHFRRIDGHANLWALAAILGRQGTSTTQSSKEKVP